jgi:hypothetical protein
MITPSMIATQPSVKELPKSSYNFVNQLRNVFRKRFPHIVAYSFNSIQTYNYNGQPYDAQGDNFD